MEVFNSPAPRRPDSPPDREGLRLSGRVIYALHTLSKKVEPAIRLKNA